MMRNSCKSDPKRKQPNMNSSNESRRLPAAMPKLAILSAAVLLAIGGCATAETEPAAGGSGAAIQGLSKEQARAVEDARKAQARNSYSEREKAAIDLAIHTVNEKEPVSKDSVSHLRIRSVDWPDSSLGCGEPGVQYMQRVIPGYFVSFNANGKLYTVHVGDDSAIVCDKFNELMAERRKRGREVIQAHNAARADLAEKLMVDPEMVKVTRIQQQTWPDSSLGCPVAGEQYAPGPVEGLVIDMTCRDRQYEYRVALDGGQMKSCKEIVSCYEVR